MALDLVRCRREGLDGWRRRQGSRLTALVRDASARSPYYRDLYGGPVTGEVRLAELPWVSKPQLMDAFDDWVTDPRVTRAGVEAFTTDPKLLGAPYLGDYFVCSSSGTTGHPGLFVHDRTSVTVLRAMTVARTDLGWLSGRDWLRLAARGFRWATVVGTGGHFAGAGWLALERRRSRWRSHAYRLFSVQRPLGDLAAALAAFAPAILTSYPSFLQLLAAEQEAGRTRLGPIVVEAAGESISECARTTMASAFGCLVHEAYAASEMLNIALDCPEGWLHVNADWAVLEPVDADHRPTPPGVASHTVLLTNLANHVQPIIRYDLGDSVLARPDPCPCGNPLPAVRVAGRCDDVLHLTGPAGQVVSILPLSIGSVAEETPGVRRVQLVQSASAAIRVRLEPRRDADTSRVWDEVLTRLRHFLAEQGLANVTVVPAPEPPEQTTGSGKFHQVIARPGTA